MKIQCLPRKWFEQIRGTVLEEQVLAQNKIVSIQSRSGWDSEPPFSEHGLESANLLCLTFDDVSDYSALEEDSVVRFTDEMAQQILEHVGSGRLPVLIHCTGGVSRSGAIGAVLDRYWNVIWEENPKDHEYFKRANPQISPNLAVKEQFVEYILRNCPGENTLQF